MPMFDQLGQMRAASWKRCCGGPSKASVFVYVICSFVCVCVRALLFVL